MPETEVQRYETTAPLSRVMKRVRELLAQDKGGYTQDSQVDDVEDEDDPFGTLEEKRKEGV